MVNDEQTHSLPIDEDVFSRFVTFAGYAGGRAFETALEGVLKTVERHYSALFEHSAALGTRSGISSSPAPAMIPVRLRPCPGWAL